MIGKERLDNEKIINQGAINQKRSDIRVFENSNQDLMINNINLEDNLNKMQQIPGMEGQKQKNQAEGEPEARMAKIVDLSTISAEMKTYRTNRSKSQIRQNNVAWQSIKEQNEEGSKNSQIADAELVKNSAELLIRDKKWTRFFFAKESPEMKKVKQSVAYLNNLLDKDVQTKISNGTETVDVEYLLNTIIPAYQTAYDACDTYINVRSAEGEKKGYGLRRLNKVKGMFKSLRREMTEIKLVVDNLQSSQKINFMEKDDLLGERIMNEHKMSVRHLMGEVVRRKAVVCRFMPEGNSSNTYRVRVKGTDDKYYYVKKEETLLNEDLPGYLDNRLAELTRSKNIKVDNKQKKRGADYIRSQDKRIEEINMQVLDKKMTEEDGDKEIQKIRSEREELRLENILDEKDYDYGIRLLTTMQNKINSLRGDNKDAQIKRYVQFFAHDFDEFFRRMKETNAKAAKFAQDAGQIDELINTLEAQKPKNWKQQVDDLKKLKKNGLRQMSELEWLEAHKEDLGINDGNGNELMAILREMGSDQADPERISRLFQRTLGKEAELFGQQASRSGTSASDVLAANNTATSRLATRFGFDDIVTKSFKGKLEMVEVGQTKSKVNNVTFSEEAPGEELLQICQDAQKLQKEKGLEKSIVHYSPQAMRDLSRMHTFDLMTCQTDRHWRNIKSNVKKTVKNGEPVWIIQNAKCYDHDQSFGTKDLKAYFKDVKDEGTGETKTVGEGFLKPIMMTVSKNSNIYKYAVQNKMTNPEKGKQIAVGYKNFLGSIELPKSKTKSLDDATVEYKARQKEKVKKDQYTHAPYTMTQRIISKFKWEDPDKLLLNGSKEQLDDQNEKIEAVVKRNPGMKKEAERFFTLMYKLCFATSVPAKDQITGVYDVVDTFLYDTEEELDKVKDKMGYNDPNIAKPMLRKTFIKEFRELTELYNSLDLTHLEEDLDMYAPYSFAGGSKTVGYYDYTFQSVFHLFKLKLQENPEKTNKAIEALAKEESEQKNKEIEKAVEDEAKKKGKSLSKKEKETAIRERKQKEESDTVRVPAILHMDLKAYQQIKNAYESEAELETLLMDLELTSDKKEALKKRLKQILDDADEAAKVVNEWADKKGLPMNAIERKFLLTEEEFKQVKNITDMALDPGESYFSVEDSQFMTGNEMMQKYLGTKEKKLAREATNQERLTRRQNMGALGENEVYTSYMNNSIAS